MASIASAAGPIPALVVNLVAVVATPGAPYAYDFFGRTIGRAARIAGVPMSSQPPYSSTWPSASGRLESPEPYVLEAW